MLNSLKHALIVSSFIASISSYALVPPLADADCLKEYRELFSHDEINVTAAFGYFDNEGKTIDRRNLDMFVKSLTASCKTWDQKMCGFKVVSTTPHVLTRKIMGPDGKAKLLRITTDAPSVSTSDAQNRVNPAQAVRSSFVKSMFLDGLKNSEVTLYMGHSRDGGGPSFSPPKLDVNGHVDYDWYHKNRTDMNDMISALAVTPNKSRIVGLLSCSSIRWFSRSIQSSAPASGIIGTNNSFSTYYLGENIPLLEKIFSYQCLSKFTIDDVPKKAQILSNKDWAVSSQTKKKTQKQITRETLDNLASQLSSEDPEVRAWAYLEIKSYPSGEYSEFVHRELNFYRMANILRKNF